MMDFTIRFQVPPLPDKIRHTDKILLAGSCFTEHIGTFLGNAKFKTLVNPNGIIFNPVSIVKAITSWIENREYENKDLFQHNDGWHSWDHHSHFSHRDAGRGLENINTSIQAAHRFLKEAGWLIITLGSAFVYELKEKDNFIVANCHKMPGERFRKRLLVPEEIIAAFGNLVYRLQLLNPELKIIFTISPVRHIRDGVVENNRSKAVLIQAVHHLVEKLDNLHYFPAYEIVMDELRDYRFYAEDMVHPNETAIRYVAEQFQKACIDPEIFPLIKELQKLDAAMKHRPFDAESALHQQFLQAHLKKAAALKEKYPYMDMKKEIAYFSHFIRE